MSDDIDEFRQEVNEAENVVELDFDEPEWSAFVVIPSPDGSSRPAIFSIPEYLAELMYVETSCPDCGHEYPLRFEHPNDGSDTE